MLLALLLSAGIGVSLGLLGGGGSILTLPILLYVLHLEPHAAITTSLLVVGVTSLAAMITHARAGRVAYRTGLSFGGASMLSAFAASHLTRGLSGAWLLAGFIAVMVVTGLSMLRPRQEPVPGSPGLLKTLVLGLAVGALTGTVGAGGGFVVVPALAMLAGLPMPRAVATSLLVIAMNSLAGFAGSVGHVHLDLPLVGLVTLSAVVGSFGGARLAGVLSPAYLRRGFGLFVLGMAAWMTLQQLPASLRASLSRDPRVTHLAAALLGALLAVAIVRLRAPLGQTSLAALPPSIRGTPP